MSISVLADGADGFALLSPEGELGGWIRGRVIGISGFDDEAAATRAAVIANRVLAEWLERNGLPPLAAFADVPTRVVHDGAHRWIMAGTVPVARLPEPAPTVGDDALTCAFEIVLRGIMNEGVAIHAALIALRAARGDIDARHIRWPVETAERVHETSLR
jgi:hypothetical protein